jgi:hypothetical protein
VCLYVGIDSGWTVDAATRAAERLLSGVVE